MDTPTALLPPEQQQEIKLYDLRVSELRKATTDLVVRDPESRQLAANLRSQVKALDKALKAAFEALTKPSVDFIAMLKTKFIPMNLAVHAALEEIDKKILADLQEQRRAVEEARRKAEEEQRRLQAKAEEEARARAAEETERARQEAIAAGFKPEEAQELAGLVGQDELGKPIAVPVVDRPSAPAKTVSTPVAKMTVSEVWDYELVNLDQVPAQYIRRELDRQKVRCAVNDGARDIPGIRIFSKGRVSS